MLATPVPTPVPQFQSQISSEGIQPSIPRPSDVSYPEPPHNTDTAPFQVLVALFDRLQHERKQDKRRKMLDIWFNHWRQEKGYDLYPVLRLLLPQKDSERAMYGLKEKSIAKIFIKLIPLGKNDPDALRLQHWKKPADLHNSSGDFPIVLYEVVQKRSSIIEGSLTIEDINNSLDELSKNTGKPDNQFKILQHIYNHTTPEQQQWLVRIILKDMVIYTKETTVFSVFHSDAQDLFNACSDLKKVAWELWDPARKLNPDDKSIQLFRAFAPMLCKRPTTRKIEESIKEMQGLTFIIEEKLDGERMQLHKRGNEYFYCSRKGKDYTYLYGANATKGSLTPAIDGAFDPRIESLILDGEMMVWDPVSERNLPFGTLKTAAADISRSKLKARPCFKVFDLLYLNGQSLLSKSLKFRRRNLHAYIKEISGSIEFSMSFEGRTAKDIRQRMDEVITSRGEGLVIKHPNSQYILNGRNKDWMKVKPEYMDHLGETVDVLVVAGFYGSGKRSGGVSGLICGVLDDRDADDEDGGGDDGEPKYSTFFRVGTGLSYSDYEWIRRKPWKVRNPSNSPSWLSTTLRGTDDKGDMYLEPKDSFILKVKAAEIIPTDQYHMNFTLRFPRVVSIRDDLNINDCMTATGVLDLLRLERKRKMEDSGGIENRKRIVKKKKAEAMILPEYSGIKAKNVQVESEIFEDMKFVVASNPLSMTADEDRKNLMKLILAHGGSCMQIARTPDIKVVYDGTSVPYDLQLLINKRSHDIIRSQWIMDSIVAGEPVPFNRKYFFFATPVTMASDEYAGGKEDKSEDEAELDADEDEDVRSGSSETLSDSGNDQGPKAKQASHESQTGHDWLKTVESSLSDEEESVTESETENDSDNEDVANDDVGMPEDDPDEDELGKQSAVKEDLEAETAESYTLTSQIRMGEDDAAMEYDAEAFFTHLCFYLDSPANARANGMTVKAKKEEEIADSFAEIGRLITAHGGRIGSLDEPKLTHVVVDKRDTSRRLELMRHTSKPKRRNIVVSEFIHACVEEGTLLPEEDFAP